MYPDLPSGIAQTFHVSEFGFGYYSLRGNSFDYKAVDNRDTIKGWAGKQILGLLDGFY
jgi:hypothetical protein